MTDSNLVQLSYVEESTWGVTPETPSMTLLRKTNIGASFEVETIQSNEIRADRQVTDLINVSARAAGSIGFELSFGAYDDLLQGALFNTWTYTPTLTNVVADTTITDVDAETSTYTVAAGGTAFKAGHIIRASGFTTAANNRIARVASSTATTVVITADPTLVDEAAPPIGARLKVIGFQGASGDVTASTTGLASTTLDFTTLGLVVGQWIKIGGTATADKFATAACNDWVRVSAIAAHALTCDNLPENWATDAGTSKTIKVFFGDRIKNGTTRKSYSIEEGFLGQATPNYLVYKGMMISRMSLTLEPGAIVAGQFEFLGKDATVSQTSLDATPTAAAANDVMNCVSDIGRITEGGETVTGPNYIQSMSIEISNELRDQRGVGFFGLVGVGVGSFNTTGNMTTYFGSEKIYERLLNSTASSVSITFVRDGQAYVISLPRIKLMGASPTVPGTNQECLLQSRYQALYDATTGYTISIDKLEYVE